MDFIGIHRLSRPRTTDFFKFHGFIGIHRLSRPRAMDIVSSRPADPITSLDRSAHLCSRANCEPTARRPLFFPRANSAAPGLKNFRSRLPVDLCDDSDAFWVARSCRSHPRPRASSKTYRRPGSSAHHGPCIPLESIVSCRPAHDLH